MQHLNFYENLDEAQRRLRGTVVMYDGIPCFVWAITAHNSDGIFRVYMQEIGKDLKFRFDTGNYSPQSADLGRALDKHMLASPEEGILRKQMNSPKFNKFRPFPLGMATVQGCVYYFERAPARKIEQGLIRQMVMSTKLRIGDMMSDRMSSAWDVRSKFFRDCVLADHPSFGECLTALTGSEFTNTAAPFHRDFALVKGLVGTLFLAYKSDIVGVLPMNDSAVVRLSQDNFHLREVVEELNVFGDVIL
jgi:hypothetical protein